MIHYNWDYETVDIYGDVQGHNYRSLLSEYNPAEYTDTLALVLDKLDKEGSVVDRFWAYVENGALPLFFSDSEGKAVARKVPDRFRTELKNHRAKDENLKVGQRVAVPHKVEWDKGYNPDKQHTYLVGLSDEYAAVYYVDSDSVSVLPIDRVHFYSDNHVFQPVFQLSEAEFALDMCRRNCEKYHPSTGSNKEHPSADAYYTYYLEGIDRSKVLIHSMKRVQSLIAEFKAEPPKPLPIPEEKSDPDFIDLGDGLYTRKGMIGIGYCPMMDPNNTSWLL